MSAERREVGEGVIGYQKATYESGVVLLYITVTRFSRREESKPDAVSMKMPCSDSEQKGLHPETIPQQETVRK